MTEATATPAADAALPSEAELAAAAAAAAAAAVEAAAKAEHDAKITVLETSHSELDGKIEDLQALLAASLEKSRDDRDHTGYTTSFLERGHLLVDELAGWIKRHV
jgi:zona occludens toxin (predicted ATPase)